MTKHEILKKYWGYDSFRGIQEQIIDEIMAGRDVLGLMPTGGGKSITFQVPALAMEGVCIVVSPLIALMKDQVQNLRKRNIKAAAIYSGMSHTKILETLENAVYGGVKILYVSPERLESELFQAKLSHMKVSFFTIDESHCICQWGYDFRPSYLKIAEIRNIHPTKPVLALTATATPAVVDDIQEKLSFHRKNCLSMSFYRENLSYHVQQSDDKLTDVLKILTETDGSAIVYVSSRDKTAEIAETLRKLGISAEGYNAGLTALHRDVRQQKWTEDRTRVIVATNAFGMGIDKPDVRVVIHFDCPTSIEAYFQEAGRAGRDGKEAKAILLVSKNEAQILRRKLAAEYPEKDFISRIYELVGCFYEVGVGCGEGYSRIFDIEKFCHTYKLFPTYVSSSLHILSNAGYIRYDDERNSMSKIRFIVDRDELYNIGPLSESLTDFMQELLRFHTGLFSSYVAIQEERIADQQNITAQQVYENLLALSRYGIIRYIPRSKEPLITFTINRVAPEHFFLPDSCYQLLKDRATERIDRMAQYITSTTTCRSKLLLDYFGETLQHDCQQCDVCLRQKALEADNQADGTSSIEDYIVQKLADRQKHHISELYTPDIPSPKLMETIQRMLQEETISARGAIVYIN